MANYCENFNSTRPRTTNHKQNRERCPKTHVHDVPRHRTSGAKGIRTPDLLDANESTWAFIGSSCDGCASKRQVRALGLLVAGSCRKFCVGPLWVPLRSQAR